MSTPTAAPRKDAFLEIESAADPTKPRVLVQADPMVTVLTSLMEGFGPLSHRLPAPVRAATRSAAGRTPIPMLLRLTASGPPAWCTPDFLNNARPATAFDQQIEQLRATPVEVLDQDLIAFSASDSHAARRWQHDPTRVLARYCSAITVYWRDVISPLYPNLEQRLQREAARLETGLADYGHDTLLGLLHPQLRPESGRLRLHRNHVSGVSPWRPEMLVLKPMVCTAATYFTNIGAADNPRVRTAFFAAAPPALRSGWQHHSSDPTDGINLLIGQPKAEILRSIRRRPGTTTDLAEELRLTPSTVSYHLKTLQAAGATATSRRGARVYYRVTGRGSRLLDA